MSLQVWLPLTKDLRQQGLSNVTVTNNGATFNSAGKLGGCYEFASGKRIQTTLPSTSNLNSKAISFACWVNISSWNSSYDCLMSIADGTGWQQSRATLCRNNTASTLCWNIADGSTSTRVYTTTSVSTNTWYHVACTYDGANLKIYVNGALNNSAAVTLSIGYAGTFNIGGWSGNNYPINCKMNDIRVYNHCLSPMEVKELAKGLVLHYPLNRQGWGQENLAHNTYNLAPFSTSQVEFKAYDVGLLDVSNGEQITISFDLDMTVATGGAGYLQVYNTNYPGPHQITAGNALAGRTLVVGQDIHERISYTTTMITRSSSSYSTDRIEFYSNYSTENEIQISNIKIERGSIATPWCPNSSDALATTMGLNGITEYDCSGFCNNGTRTGTFTWTSNTPKYNVSQYFQDYTQYISCSVNGWTPTALTLSCWVKSSNKSPRGNWHIPLNIDGQNAEISIYKNGQITTGFVIGGTRRTGNFGSVDILDGQWHMLTVTFDGNTIKSYIDAVLIESRNYSGALSPMNTVYLGIFGGNNTYANTQLYQSDSRIYATALSADDVKSLYQNSAYIDSSGNVYGAVHSEV